MLDNNGFIIISEQHHQTGRFFGDMDGAIMESLIEWQIYQRIRIYDYQAVCTDPLSLKSAEKAEADFKNMSNYFDVFVYNFPYFKVFLKLISQFSLLGQFYKKSFH